MTLYLGFDLLGSGEVLDRYAKEELPKIMERLKRLEIERAAKAITPTVDYKGDRSKGRALAGLSSAGPHQFQ